MMKVAGKPSGMNNDARIRPIQLAGPRADHKRHIIEVNVMTK